MTATQVCFIGGGNMGSAIIAGLDRQPGRWQVAVCDQAEAVRLRHAAAGRTVGTEMALAATAEVVVLAVKPQVAGPVLAELAQIASTTSSAALYISIMAGIPLRRLQSGLGRAARIVRAMPNTPLAIGQGMVGLSPGERATTADVELATALFAGAGKTLQIDEAQMDALTAVSGSGPAYLFRLAEAQVAAAMGLGFDRQAAVLLVGQTLAGSIAYLLSQDDFPAARLRQEVTSPGGTTAAGLAELTELDELFERAYQAAERRGVELAAAAAEAGA